jgi:hypothetical protein
MPTDEKLPRRTWLWKIVLLTTAAGAGSSTFRLSTNSSVDVAHGLVLLFGLGTKALPPRVYDGNCLPYTLQRL